MADTQNFDETSLDDLLWTLEQILSKQSIEGLIIIAVLMGGNRDSLEGKSKRTVKKIIEKIYEGILDDDDKNEQEKRKYIVDVIKQASVVGGNKSSDEKKTDDKQEDVNKNKSSEEVHHEIPNQNEAQANSKDDTNDKPKIEEQKKEEENIKDSEGNIEVLRELGILKKTSLLRREFRVKGQIGEVGQADKLSYVSLMHQITEGKAAGYDEDDIVNGVIRAMIPSLTLRNVLETTSNLTLERLLHFLEAHFDEKNTTDLWSKLTSMSQLPEETSYSFVLKCIELRQKILLASRKSDIKFDKPLLDKVFFKTLEKGLSSTYVIQEIRPLLKAGVSDETLITEVTKASAAEKERNAIQSKNKKVLRVNQVQQDDTTSKLVSAVESLTKQLSSLQNDFDDLRKGNVNKRYMCADCKSKGSRLCNHCFHCGSTNHIARNCSNKHKSGQGN